MNTILPCQGVGDSTYKTQSTDNTTTILDGGGTARPLSVTNSINETVYFTIENLTIENGFVSTDGGAGLLIDNSNGAILSVTIRNCFFQNNSTSSSQDLLGGAIKTTAPMEVYNTAFVSNVAHGGGAIYIAGLPSTPASAHNVLLDGCSFNANLPIGLRGGVHIYSAGANLTIRNTTFSGKEDKTRFDRLGHL